MESGRKMEDYSNRTGKWHRQNYGDGELEQSSMATRPYTVTSSKLLTCHTYNAVYHRLTHSQRMLVEVVQVECSSDTSIMERNLIMCITLQTLVLVL